MVEVTDSIRDLEVWVLDAPVGKVKVPGREGRPEREFFERQAFLVGTFSRVPFQLSATEESELEGPGVYTFGQDLLGVSGYGRLEIRAGFRLIYLGELPKEVAASKRS